MTTKERGRTPGEASSDGPEAVTHHSDGAGCLQERCPEAPPEKHGPERGHGRVGLPLCHRGRRPRRSSCHSGASEVMEACGRHGVGTSEKSRLRAHRADGGLQSRAWSFCKRGPPEAAGLPSSAPARAAGGRKQGSPGGRGPDAASPGASAQPAAEPWSPAQRLPCVSNSMNLLVFPALPVHVQGLSLIGS